MRIIYRERKRSKRLISICLLDTPRATFLLHPTARSRPDRRCYRAASSANSLYRHALRRAHPLAATLSRARCPRGAKTQLLSSSNEPAHARGKKKRNLSFVYILFPLRRKNNSLALIHTLSVLSSSIALPSCLNERVAAAVNLPARLFEAI